MSVDPRDEARILAALDKKTELRDQYLAALAKIAEDVEELVVEGARLGIARVKFVGRPFSNRIITRIYQDHGLTKRPRKKAPATSGKRATKKG